MAGGFFDKLAGSLLKLGARELINRVLKKDRPLPTSSPDPVVSESPKVHPWRLCPVGQHWVNPHPLKVHVSEKNPDGLTTRHTECRNNPVRGRKKSTILDYLHPDEIYAIAEAHFKDLTGPPTSGKLPYTDSDKYDALIRGWSRYWNEVFQPKEPLDPDLVKALIGSESSFRLKPPVQNAGSAGGAHGLIQLTDQTIRALGDPSGELKNHLIQISREGASDPNLAICAGIRWLFYKRERASRKLGREATWREGIAEYKNYLKDMLSGKNPKPEGMDDIDADYRKLKK